MDFDSDFSQLLTLALSEDIGSVGDLTSLALVPDTAQGAAAIVARSGGIVAGALLVKPIMSAVDPHLVWEPALEDSAVLNRGTIIGTLSGAARGILTAERTLLNFLGRLTGIATLTRQYVDAVAGTGAKIYDTRKTTPGWRRLEKYAVRCGGGQNHRTGLYDAVLIKDNHLAQGQQGAGTFSPAEAVCRAKDFLRLRFTILPMVQVEVDTLEQLREVLPTQPDIVLLDNMTPAQIAEAVHIRNAVAPAVQLEASGGITLATIRTFAETGVERISVGALTHSAVSLDLGLDWTI